MMNTLYFLAYLNLYDDYYYFYIVICLNVNV